MRLAGILFGVQIWSVKQTQVSAKGRSRSWGTAL